MRLNFSGVGDEEIREGVRRIGNVVAEQMELYGTLTGDAKARPACPTEARTSGPTGCVPTSGGGRRCPDER